MLSLFPQVLFLAPLGITFLRIAVGIVFIYAAWCLLQEDKRFASVPLPLIGRPPVFLIWILGIGIGTVGALLFVGFITQLAALIGAVITLIRILLRRRYDAIRPIVYSKEALLFVICLSLVVLGGGAFAFDLPL